MNRKPLIVVLVICIFASPLFAQGNDDLLFQITPLPMASRKALTDMQSGPHIIVHRDWYYWCPSVLKAEDGKYHMFHTRWPKSIGFLSWLTHSEIVHEVADTPEGPYRTLAVAIPPTGKDRGDWFTAHNSKIKKFNNEYYLYFCQTRGNSFAKDGETKRLKMAKTGYQDPLWKNEARPNQRTFIASSKSLEGPWKVSEEPIIQPAKTITTLTVNPAVCQGPNGTYFMIIKGDKPGGNGMRSQALATAPLPEGPWTIQDNPVIDNLDTEDVSMWYDQTRKRFYAVFHAHTFIGMMTSADGINWEKAKQYKLMSKGIPFDDGTVWMPQRMERPFVLTDEKGSPIMLYVACLRGNMSANIALSVRICGSEP